MRIDGTQPEKTARGRMLRRAAGPVLVTALTAAVLAGQALARSSGSTDAAAEPADVGIAVTASPDPVNVGENLTYSVTVTNAGPARATGVNVRFLLSGRKSSFVSATATQGVCEPGGNRVVCRLDRIEPTGTARATIVVNPGLGPSVTASATVTTSSPDPNASNEQVLLTTRVTEKNPPSGVRITGADMARPFQNSLQFTVRWTGKDVETGINTFDVRYRRAPLGHDFGQYVAWQSHVKTKGASFPAVPGSTYCFSVRATDVAGNTSAWSAEQCTAIPVGVSSFVRNGGWLLFGANGYFTSHYVYSSIKGATLIVPRVVARSLALVASKCPGCGSVTVYWNGKALRTINVGYPFPAKRQIFPLVRFKAVQAGSVRIVLTSIGKRVKIEGLGISRV